MFTLRAVVALVTLVVTANAAVATAPDTENAREIVRAADAAMRKIEAVSYTPQIPDESFDLAFEQRGAISAAYSRAAQSGMDSHSFVNVSEAPESPTKQGGAISNDCGPVRDNTDECINGSAGARTQDPRLKRPLLCQLSYTP